MMHVWLLYFVCVHLHVFVQIWVCACVCVCVHVCVCVCMHNYRNSTHPQDSMVALYLLMSPGIEQNRRRERGKRGSWLWWGQALCSWSFKLGAISRGTHVPPIYKKFENRYYRVYWRADYRVYCAIIVANITAPRFSPMHIRCMWFMTQGQFLYFMGLTLSPIHDSYILFF